MRSAKPFSFCLHRLWPSPVCHLCFLLPFWSPCLPFWSPCHHLCFLLPCPLLCRPRHSFPRLCLLPYSLLCRRLASRPCLLCRRSSLLLPCPPRSPLPDERRLLLPQRWHLALQHPEAAGDLFLCPPRAWRGAPHPPRAVLPRPPAPWARPPRHVPPRRRHHLEALADALDAELARQSQRSPLLRYAHQKPGWPLQRAGSRKAQLARAHHQSVLHRTRAWSLKSC
mmetsp:Transcript_23115/g.41349  ORF Transcript_23115/g.41349 Transcript_23115/m.41349 type:complete len:225 (+) Transcript_23115:452-1126(+)